MALLGTGYFDSHIEIVPCNCDFSSEVSLVRYLLSPDFEIIVKEAVILNHH